MKLIAAGLTNVGMKRPHNEDNHLVLPEENLFLVADGMGGHQAGEVASQMAVDTIAEFFQRTAHDDDVTWPFKEEQGLKYEENRLVTSIKHANRRIFETARVDAKKNGMGTTVVSALFTNNGAYVGHCGDSRCYRWRDGELELLTEDHSLLNDHLKNHKMTPEEIANFPYKNVIVRALGMKESILVDISRLELLPKDIYLLCSDGLSGMVSDEQMQKMITDFIDDPDRENDMKGLCQILIDAANANGGADNVTCIIIKILE